MYKELAIELLVTIYDNRHSRDAPTTCQYSVLHRIDFQAEHCVMSQFIHALQLSEQSLVVNFCKTKLMYYVKLISFVKG